MVGSLADQKDSRSVGRLDRSVRQRLVAQKFRDLAGWLDNTSVGWKVSRSVGWLENRLIRWKVSRSVGWLDRFIL